MVYHIHFCILMCLSIQAATAQTLLSNEFRRARQLFGAETIKSAAELATCQAIMTSINAQFFEQNVFIPPSTNLEDLKEKLEPLEMQIIEEPPHEDDGKSRFGYTVDVDRSERIARTLRSSVYAKKICDPTRFHPYVVETGDASMSCYDICAACVPGSASVCHQRNHRFPGIAQTCFCTYDIDQPLHNAVLVLKNAIQPSSFY
ncbi:hypothetical protein M3Y98_01209300 [Aphelenchoides besseyi]|nr:hypothetical protein M3Y98_01209300 [Aphelenchoides besseyi]